MIEVTKDGDLEKYKNHMYYKENCPTHFKCKVCGCEFTATKQDYKKNIFTGNKTAFCPKCNLKVKWYNPNDDWY